MAVWGCRRRSVCATEAYDYMELCRLQLHEFPYHMRYQWFAAELVKCLKFYATHPPRFAGCKKDDGEALGVINAKTGVWPFKKARFLSNWNTSLFMTSGHKKGSTKRLEFFNLSLSEGLRSTLCQRLGRYSLLLPTSSQEYNKQYPHLWIGHK